MWRHLEDFVQRADERLPPVVFDAGVAIAAAVIITFLVRSVVG